MEKWSTPSTCCSTIPFDSGQENGNIFFPDFSTSREDFANQWRITHYEYLHVVISYLQYLVHILGLV